MLSSKIYGKDQITPKEETDDGGFGNKTTIEKQNGNKWGLPEKNKDQESAIKEPFNSIY